MTTILIILNVILFQLVLVNTVIIVGGAIYFFKKNYTVLDNETVDTLTELAQKQVEEDQASQELAGGCGCSVGFGADYLEDDYEEEDE